MTKQEIEYICEILPNLPFVKHSISKSDNYGEWIKGYEFAKYGHNHFTDKLSFYLKYKYQEISYYGSLGLQIAYFSTKRKIGWYLAFYKLSIELIDFQKQQIIDTDLEVEEQFFVTEYSFIRKEKCEIIVGGKSEFEIMDVIPISEVHNLSIFESQNLFICLRKAGYSFEFKGGLEYSILDFQLMNGLPIGHLNLKTYVHLCLGEKFKIKDHRPSIIGFLNDESLFENDFEVVNTPLNQDISIPSKLSSIKEGSILVLADKILDDYKHCIFYTQTNFDDPYRLFKASKEKDFRYLKLLLERRPTEFYRNKSFRYTFREVRRLFSGTKTIIKYITEENGEIIVYTDLFRIQIEKALACNEVEVLSSKLDFDSNENMDILSFFEDIHRICPPFFDEKNNKLQISVDEFQSELFHKLYLSLRRKWPINYTMTYTGFLRLETNKQ